MDKDGHLFFAGEELTPLRLADRLGPDSRCGSAAEPGSYVVFHEKRALRLGAMGWRCLKLVAESRPIGHAGRRLLFTVTDPDAGAKRPTCGCSEPAATAGRATT